MMRSCRVLPEERHECGQRPSGSRPRKPFGHQSSRGARLVHYVTVGGSAVLVLPHSRRRSTCVRVVVEQGSLRRPKTLCLRRAALRSSGRIRSFLAGNAIFRRTARRSSPRSAPGELSRDDCHDAVPAPRAGRLHQAARRKSVLRSAAVIGGLRQSRNDPGPVILFDAIRRIRTNGPRFDLVPSFSWIAVAVARRVAQRQSRRAQCDVARRR